MLRTPIDSKLIAAEWDRFVHLATSVIAAMPARYLCGEHRLMRDDQILEWLHEECMSPAR